MTIREINQTLQELGRAAWQAEQLYIEQDGEVTAETEALEAQAAALRKLLEDENAVDDLGRWHKSKEDELATYKAEKAAVEARIKATQRTLDFIKGKITDTLKAIGKEKVKGQFYGYTASQSSTTTCDNERLQEDYGQQLQFAAKQLGVPYWVDIKLSGKVSNLAEGEPLPDYFIEDTTDTVRFSKPRKPKNATTGEEFTPVMQ